MKYLIVGLNPSLKNDNPYVPFVGTRSGITLDSWLKDIGIDKVECVFINVLPRATKSQAGIKKSEIDLDDLHERISMMRCGFYKDAKIITLGQLAAWALDQVGAQFLALPHPSGLNRQLNDKMYVKSMIKDARRWIREEVQPLRSKQARSQ